MARVIAVANQKGGVGKTTKAVNLSACLADVGKEVLLLDIDPQGNATSGIGLEKKEIKLCIYDALINEIPLKKIIVPSRIKNLDVVPATIQLAGAEIELVTTMSREVRLRNVLAEVREQYEYIIIDCPPSLGLLTINALTAADTVLVPIQCEYYALEGLSQLTSTVKLVQKYLNSKLRYEGVLLTMFDARTNLSVQVEEEVRKVFKSQVFSVVIPRNVRLSEAPSHGLPIILYDERSRGAETYTQLAKEVIANG
ncbi:MAG: ParA family protein [Firmicutes bacterium]|nr:ParA family protein [Bacillota bacterium]